uniref:Uncharacterized protein n=1 Tax=Meloidogyne incognita TaxID=6306 RepID=A0A914NPM9_MELIC
MVNIILLFPSYSELESQFMPEFHLRILLKTRKPSIVILDDLMYTIDEKYLSELFTKKSHHLNFGIIFITQNLFEKKLKVARQNSMYIVLTRAPNSALAVRNLGVQLFPGRLNYFLDAYRQATSSSNYSYLFIDLHPSSDPILRLRTNIFIDKESEDIYNSPNIIFLSKNSSIKIMPTNISQLVKDNLLFSNNSQKHDH